MPLGGVGSVVCDGFKMFAENIVGVVFEKAGDVLYASEASVENMFIHTKAALDLGAPGLVLLLAFDHVLLSSTKLVRVF